MLKTVIEYDNLSSIDNKASLYNQFVKILLKKELEKPRSHSNRCNINYFIENELEICLEKIAYQSLRNGKILEISLDEFKNYGLSSENKEILLNTGIILEFFEIFDKKIQFRHQSFQSYFAAKYIVKQKLEGISHLINNLRYFYNDAWFEVICFCFQLEHKEQLINETIDNFLNFENLDALSHLKNVYICSILFQTLINIPEVLHAIGYYIENLIYSRYIGFFLHNTDKFKAISKVQRTLLFDAAIKPLLNIEYPDIIVENLKLIKNIYIDCPKEIIEKVYTFQNSNDTEIKKSLACLLSKISTNESLEILRKLTQDEEMSVKISAFFALLQRDDIDKVNIVRECSKIDLNFHFEYELKDLFKKEISLNHIHALLNDKNSYVRKLALEIIFEKTLDKEERKELVLNALKDRHCSVRRQAFLLSYDIFNSNDIDKFKHFLNHRNFVTRRDVIELIGGIGQFKDAEIIIPLLSDKDDTVKETVVRALKNIGLPKHADLIRPFFSHEWIDLRHAAIETLGKIGDKSDAKKIMEIINNDKEFYLSNVIDPLKELGDPEDIEYIKNCKNEFEKDEKNFVQTCVINNDLASIKKYIENNVNDISMDNKNRILFKAIESSENYNLFFELLNNEDYNNIKNDIYHSIEVCNCRKFLKEYINREKDILFKEQAILGLGNCANFSDIEFLEEIIRKSELYNYIYAASIAINRICELNLRYVECYEPDMSYENNIKEESKGKILILDVVKNKIIFHDIEIKLTTKEFDFIYELASKPYKTITFEELYGIKKFDDYDETPKINVRKNKSRIINKIIEAFNQANLDLWLFEEYGKGLESLIKAINNEGYIMYLKDYQIQL